MTPTIGRIVIFQINDHSECPAIIVRVWSDTLVSLQLFPDSDFSGQLNQSIAENERWRTSIQLGEAGVANRWRWPERV